MIRMYDGTMVPVIIEATEMAIKFKENLEAIPAKHSVESQYKAAILGASHIIRKVMQPATRSLRRST